MIVSGFGRYLSRRAHDHERHRRDDAARILIRLGRTAEARRRARPPAPRAWPGRGLAVAGQVQREDRPARVERGELGEDGMPARSVESEAVEQDQRRRAARFPGEVPGQVAG